MPTSARAPCLSLLLSSTTYAPCFVLTCRPKLLHGNLFACVSLFTLSMCCSVCFPMPFSSSPGFDAFFDYAFIAHFFGISCFGLLSWFCWRVSYTAYLRTPPSILNSSANLHHLNRDPLSHSFRFALHVGFRV